MTDITEMAQSLKAAAEGVIKNYDCEWFETGRQICTVHKSKINLISLANPVNVLALVEALEKSEKTSEARREAIDRTHNMFVRERERANAAEEALEKAQQRNAELEAQNDYFAYLVAMARVSADKAIRKFPQPNYVLLKVAEEAGEVVKAGVHYAENRMEWGQVEGEIIQLLAMLIRLVTEGDQVNGITPPALCSAGIKVEAE